VTSAAPVTVTATLTNVTTGAALSGQVVTFSTTAGYGTFSATTALTDANGKATVYLYPASSTTVGADTVNASATVNGTAVTKAVGFSTTASNVSIASFTSDLSGTALGPYGQSTLTIQVTGAATGASVGITLSSVCATAGKATLTPSTTTTTTGAATFTYKDTGGCGSIQSTDTLQATITGSTSSASLPIALTSPSASSVTFVSASPETIYLRGSGFSETSTLVFEVQDFAGNPLPGRSVAMDATTYTGGLKLDGGSTTVTKTSDSNGRVSVLVNSGTVPTPVRVRATLSGGLVSTSSSNLSIAVGLPSQLNFSMSQGSLNIEGYDRDGTTNSYTIYAADRMGNPVPAGTSINFITEGGQIASSSQISIANGIASTSVNFVSASPRPNDGRVTVVAYALGEESFLDANGNNTYDSGEDFQDLGDVFLSRSFRQTYDASASDQRIAQTLSSVAACAAHTSPLLDFNASIPSVTTFSGASRCDGSWGAAYVRRAVQTVLSTSSASPLWGTTLPSVAGSTVGLSNGCSKSSLIYDNAGSSTSFYDLGAGYLYDLPKTGVLSFLVADANPIRLNPMAAGTTISATATTGITVSITGGSPVPSSSDVTAAGVSYSFDSATTGTITINFTSPSGLITSVPLFVKQTGASGTDTACSL
jgi:hypothetical protein